MSQGISITTKLYSSCIWGLEATVAVTGTVAVVAAGTTGALL